MNYENSRNERNLFKRATDLMRKSIFLVNIQEKFKTPLKDGRKLSFCNNYISKICMYLTKQNKTYT